MGIGIAKVGKDEWAITQLFSLQTVAIDSYQANPEAYRVQAAWDQQLDAVSEGSQTTLGAYHRQWQ